jgi:hypothetical protein
LRIADLRRFFLPKQASLSEHRLLRARLFLRPFAPFLQTLRRRQITRKSLQNPRTAIVPHACIRFRPQVVFMP